MSILFEATEINGMKLANRFVRSATWEGMAADDGGCTPRLTELTAELARGGVGLIITSHAYVRPEGRAVARQIGVHRDELVEGLREMTAAAHGHGSRIVLQIAHSGHMANPKLTGQPALAPSAVAGFAKTPPREMSVSDIEDVADAFGRAAGRAQAAGFDGVQLHLAHGYLLSQFLSPAFNQRQDEYGGTVENRARAALAVLGRVRAAVGDNYPVLVKINSQDFVAGGVSEDDSLQAALLLEKAGIDALEVSGGTMFSGDLIPPRAKINAEEKEAYFRDAARRFKERLGIPVILVGGVRSFGIAERMVKEGCADYISMSRPFIREPGLVRRWQSGDLRRATCASDNQCFGAAMAGEGIYCVVERKQQKKG
ncbi:MAG: NADH:flavin oxidoreductase [Deltaproteobacteria bacterium]|nr:NADH:flavin oxidoreductase [Deltaproteobacteria bacterium]